MIRNTTDPRRMPGIVIMTLCAIVLGVPAAEATEPSIAVLHDGSFGTIYPVSEIEQIGFEGDQLVVVTSTGGADTYPLETIHRIEIRWEAARGENSAAGGVAALRKAIHLFQNHPNPFAPATRIGFALPQAGHVELGIYGVDGRLIRNLVNEKRSAGSHRVSWDGRADGGQKVPSGVYFYRLAAPGVKESRQMILLP